MDNKVRRDTKAPDEVWVVNSEDTAEWRSRERSLVRNELSWSEADVVEPFRPVVAVGCIMMTNGCFVLVLQILKMRHSHTTTTPHD